MEVHLLEARGAKKRFPEYKERALTWLRPAEAAALVNESELQGLFRRMERRKDPSGEMA
ncbi:hypothetical protein [Rhizobium lentis]|uniref:hypothetical protein n=1 Tax=Rhizobium lentis TaxID=1138194 RepID=UPI001C83463C|nr:hypothetical protein [Rhizobium lentis]